MIAVYFFAAVLVLFFTSLVYRQFRKKAMISTAEDLGLVFTEKADLHFLKYLESLPFPLFRQGESRSVINLLEGAYQDFELKIFDFSFTNKRGKRKSYKGGTVCLFADMTIDRPDFQLVPKTFLGGRNRSGNEIDLSQFPYLQSHYHLFSPQATSAGVVLGKITEILPNFSGLNLELRDGKLMIYKGQKNISATSLKSNLCDWLKIVENLVE